MESWRTRMTWAMNRGRTIERQAAGLRERLARFANEPGEAQRGEVAQSVKAMRDQLELVERLLVELGEPSRARSADEKGPPGH